MLAAPAPTSPRVQAALRVVVMLAGAVALGRLHADARPLTLCPLRAVTGIPCPLCGGTTAAASLGDLRPLDALRASPLAVLGAPLVAALPLLHRWRGRLPTRLTTVTVVAALVASEVWQLARFGLL